MRILPARARPNIIDIAFISRPQKGARRLIHDSITVFIFGQVFLFELIGFEPEVFRDTLSICVGHNRWYRRTAVSAFQAINPAEYFFVSSVRGLVECLRVYAFQSLETILGCTARGSTARHPP